MPRTKQFDTDEVLVKAMNQFWRYGYQATSMQDLVDCMGLGRGSLYLAFGDKHSLFVQVLRHYDRIWRKDPQTELARLSSPRRAVLDMFEAAIRVAVVDGSRDGCLLINTALELSPHDKQVGVIVACAFAETEAFLRASIKRGKALGEISQDVDPRRTASSLLTLFIGLRVLVRSRPEEPLLRSIVRQAEELLPPNATDSGNSAGHARSD